MSVKDQLIQHLKNLILVVENGGTISHHEVNTIKYLSADLFAINTSGKGKQIK